MMRNDIATVAGGTGVAAALGAWLRARVRARGTVTASFGKDDEPKAAPPAASDGDALAVASAAANAAAEATKIAQRALDEVEDVRRQLAAERTSYETRIAALEAELAAERRARAQDLARIRELEGKIARLRAELSATSGV